MQATRPRILDVILASQIVRLMERDRVSVADVSRGTGIAQSTLEDWKNGRMPRNFSALKGLADYFRVSLDYLIFGVQPEDDGRDRRKYVLELKVQAARRHLEMILEE